MTWRQWLCSVVIVCVVAASVAAQENRTRSVWDGVYSEKQAETGRELYTKNCASCHSDSLLGGEQAPALTGGEFLANWNGLSAGELIERVRTTMPPGKPGKLTRQNNAEVLAYMFLVNRFPAGKEEMPSQTEVLKQIQILMAKP